MARAAFEAYARPVGIAALAAAVVAFFLGGRFVRYHEQALEEEAERAFPGPLVPPKKPQAELERAGLRARRASATPPA